MSPFGWYMNSHSIDTTTIEVTTGRKYTVRKKLTPRILTLISSARPSAKRRLERHDDDREEDRVAQRLPERRRRRRAG